MKKTKKKDILMLIFLLILIIVLLRAFIKSRANNILEITANMKDNNAILSDTEITLNAINEGESGFSIILPEFIDTKKVNKYIVTKKEIISSDNTNIKNTIVDDNLINESENNTINDSTNIIDKEESVENIIETQSEINIEENNIAVLNNDSQELISTTTIDIAPGEKIYLTQEEVETLKINLTLEYDTKFNEKQRLYNQKIVLKDGEDEVLTVLGYMPSDINIKENKFDISSKKEHILSTYENATIIKEYDIKLFSNSEEYIPKDYGENLKIKIPISNSSASYKILELENDNENLKEITVESNKIVFSIQEFKQYVLLQYGDTETIALEEDEEDLETLASTVEDSALIINDFESDKNYYIGLNYTEGMSKVNSGKYSESNLKEIQINYYSYDYDKEDSEYGTISDTEKQTRVSYIKCVPTDNNGNIKLELIDNPFMNRPPKKGFNGWITNNEKYEKNITTNANTFVQTLSTNINDIINDEGKYVIDLYSNWVDANVIFVSSSGSSSNTGTSIDKPINNNWNTINSKLNSNTQTISNASNREVNIIVLLRGTLDISGVTGPSCAYTLTSLYDGTNYGSTSTYINVGTTNAQLDSDLQLHHLYIYTNSSYTSPNATTDGTSAVSPCLYGNMYNLRIGRGIIATNTNNCTWAQVQGGYYNHNSSEYRLIIESGKYYNFELYRSYGDTNSTRDTNCDATMIVGSDIDRNNKNNENLKLYNRMASKTASATASAGTTNGKAVNMIIKSGTIGVNYFETAGTSDSSNRNYAGIYVGGHGYAESDISDRYLLVEGGNIANIIGGLGMDEEYMYKTYMYIKGGNIINITGGAGYTHTYGDRIIQVTGGYIKYSISGGSNGVAASSSSNNGQLTGNALIYIGGNAQIGASSTIDSNGNEIVSVTDTSQVLYGVNAGTVCGGANGNSSYAGQTDSSYIIIDGNAIIHNNVFGGGNYGVIGASDSNNEASILEFKNKTSSFTANEEYLITTSTSGGNGLSISGTSLANETLQTSAEPNNSSKWIFEQNTENEYYIKNASTGKYIYVSNVSGIWTYTGTVTLSDTNKTSFTVSGTNTKTISYKYTSSQGGWGGGGSSSYTLYLRYSNGWGVSSSTSGISLYLLTYEMLPQDDIVEDADTLVNIKVLGGNIKNNIYGGANQNNIYGTSKIALESGTINGIVYGGSNLKGTISGSVLIDVLGGNIGQNDSSDALFGGGLGENTYVKGRVRINISESKNNLNVYGNIYGGSSLGSVNNNIEINIQDLLDTVNTVNITGNVFGGGKGDNSTSAIVTGNITINVDGSNLSNCNIFGGSNINGDISGNIKVNIGKTYETKINSVYGGGNQADILTDTQSVNVYLLSKANVTNAFNGGKSADLISSGEDDTTRAIYLQGGTVKNLYGGSDSSGEVTVSNVFIESGNAINVYGGNNQGGTTKTTKIKITGGTITNVYGGGEHAESTTSNIIIDGGVSTNIYGGGNQAGVEKTNIETQSGNVGTIFGGSNKSGDVSESYITTNDKDSNNSQNNLTMDVKSTVTKAESWQNQNYPDYITYAVINVTFKNNTANSINSWNSNVYIPDSILFNNYSQSDIQVNDGNYSLTEKNRYYGTNTISAGGTYNLEFQILTKQSIENFLMGYGIKGTDSSGNSVNYSKSVIGTVYGGNNQGGTTQTTNILINGNSVKNVYGGGNQAVSNLTNVNINGKVQKVFGGGNQASVNTDTNVIITNAVVDDNVYGGGNEGTVKGNTYVKIKNSTVNNNIYAGGNGVSAVVYGNTNLTMEGNNTVTNSVFGGGNQAATGTETNNNSKSTVNIVGAKVGKNVYGGANTSVVYGVTQMNIGYDAVGDSSLEIGNIEIIGTVFGRW